MKAVRIADALFAVEGTRAKTAKVAALAAALADVAERDPARLPFVTRFLTGTLLPTEDLASIGSARLSQKFGLTQWHTQGDCHATKTATASAART